MDTNQPQTKFHMTVGTTPTPEWRTFGIQSELRLLKAALLYSDEVEFCSVTSARIMEMVSLSPLTEEQVVEVLTSTGQYPELKILLNEVNRLSHKKLRTRQELRGLRALQQRLDELYTRTREHFGSLASKTGFAELETARKKGLLTIHLFEASNTDQLVDEYFEAVSNAILSGQTYPLFDNETGALVRAAVNEGKLNPSQMSVSRAKHTGLSSDLLQRLPLFETASLDEIIDIRAELDRPLTRFRSAVINYSNGIKSAVWDEDFALEAEHTFRAEVEPAILDIEDACRSNKPLLQLVPSFSEKSLLPVSTSALGLLLAQASQLPEIVRIGLGAAAVASGIGLQVAAKFREQQTEIESNNLYFYYKAGKIIYSREK